MNNLDLTALKGKEGKGAFYYKVNSYGDMLCSHNGYKSDYKIEDVLILNDYEWRNFSNNFKNNKCVKENIKKMYVKDDIYYCLLITNQKSPFGIIVMSEKIGDEDCFRYCWLLTRIALLRI